ncbi:MAG: hypothetical protein KAG53_05865, partial [Endozoicomonadaceae bacterium]|nr:hypothetical protein [Endozoicomonadaceae bacterium]
MNNSIDGLKLTFREKISYIKNTSKYKGVLFKAYMICSLLLSCGQCNLHIMRIECEHLIKYKGDFLFSRKISIVMPDLLKSTYINLSHANNTASEPQETNNVKTQSEEVIHSPLLTTDPTIEHSSTASSDTTKLVDVNSLTTSYQCKTRSKSMRPSAECEEISSSELMTDSEQTDHLDAIISAVTNEDCERLDILLS